VSTVQTHHSVSELTTRPRLGEDCWSRGLQSACFWQVAGWRVVHPGASLVDAHRFAPPLALGNRDLHALLLRLGRSSVGCLVRSAPGSRSSSGCGGCHYSEITGAKRNTLRPSLATLEVHPSVQKTPGSSSGDAEALLEP
jgi:hypothetical protein